MGESRLATLVNELIVSYFHRCARGDHSVGHNKGLTGQIRACAVLDGDVELVDYAAMKALSAPSKMSIIPL